MATFACKGVHSVALKNKLGLNPDPCFAFTLQQKLCTREENYFSEEKVLCQEMRVKIDRRKELIRT